MIENNTLRIGGNSIYLWIGKWLKSIGIFLTNKGETTIVNANPILVTNPTSKFINYCTLLFSFTVNRSNETGVISTEKYQIILESVDFKERFKGKNDGDESDLSIEEMLHCINQNQKKWFKKY